jgi:hypothetical protein
MVEIAAKDAGFDITLFGLLYHPLDKCFARVIVFSAVVLHAVV